MQVSDFTQEMTRRGCVADNKIFCGTYQGFPFAVRFISGKEGRRTTFNLSVQFASKVPTKMFRQARASVKGLGKLYNAKNNPTLYSVTLEVPKDENLGTAFDQLMTATVEAAQTFALAAPIGCPICNLPGCDAYAYHGESYQPVHAACVHNHALTQAAKAEDNALNGSYALGGLGALLGALVGALPTVLLVVFFDRISGLLCALIPLCAYYGYKLLREAPQ